MAATAARRGPVTAGRPACRTGSTALNPLSGPSFTGNSAYGPGSPGAAGLSGPFAPRCGRDRKSSGQDPQVQFGPHVHGEQVQLGLSQAEVGWPQLQSGPQVHGEQEQSGLSQPSVSLAFLSVTVGFLSRGCGLPDVAAALHDCLSDQYRDEGHPVGGIEHRQCGGDDPDREDSAARRQRGGEPVTSGLAADAVCLILIAARPPGRSASR